VPVVHHADATTTARATSSKTNSINVGARPANGTRSRGKYARRMIDCVHVIVRGRKLSALWKMRHVM
jgi:hypothetical protein